MTKEELGQVENQSYISPVTLRGKKQKMLQDISLVQRVQFVMPVLAKVFGISTLQMLAVV